MANADVAAGSPQLVTLIHTTPPPIADREARILALMNGPQPPSAGQYRGRWERIRSAFACALHMHAPTIAARATTTTPCPSPTATGAWPTSSPQLIGAGCDPQPIPPVEWLGSFWSHPVAPSTPIPDLKLQTLAGLQQFAALFSEVALQRVRGFSPPEMALPNHPDTHFAFVSALRECGYRWLLVQEHSVENPDGTPLSRAQTLLPNRLVARSSSGEQVAITVLMSQIADGENGGVMMNELPPAFIQAHRHLAASGSDTVALNGSEYLELLAAAGLDEVAFPPIQAVQQHRLWQRLGEGESGGPTPAAVEAAIAALQAADGGFSMAGASWTNNISWVEGYANVLEPMQQLSARFHQRFDPLLAADPAITATPAYQQALLQLLLLETSCFRYWGQGTWTDYAAELHRRGMALLESPSGPPP